MSYVHIMCWTLLVIIRICIIITRFTDSAFFASSSPGASRMLSLTFLARARFLCCLSMYPYSATRYATKRISAIYVNERTRVRVNVVYMFSGGSFVACTHQASKEYPWERAARTTITRRTQYKEVGRRSWLILRTSKRLVQ